VPETEVSNNLAEHLKQLRAKFVLSEGENGGDGCDNGKLVKLLRVLHCAKELI
jgi:hypothetical protein